MSTPRPHTEQRQVVGGACLHTGTTPSTTLREAVPYLIGRRLYKERHYAA
jgi:pyruvate/2-oxoglutarate dehydrogenase complex dihydrolipoamide dehydrogenase (E3) component